MIGDVTESKETLYQDDVKEYLHAQNIILDTGWVATDGLDIPVTHPSWQSAWDYLGESPPDVQYFSDWLDKNPLPIVKELTPGTTGLRLVQLVYPAVDAFLTLPVEADIIRKNETADEIRLSDVCESISIRGGLDNSDLDVSPLSSKYLMGYPIARQCTGVDALQPLLASYFAYATDYDGKLRFNFLGGDA